MAAARIYILKVPNIQAMSVVQGGVLVGEEENAGSSTRRVSSRAKRQRFEPLPVNDAHIKPLEPSDSSLSSRSASSCSNSSGDSSNLSECEDHDHNAGNVNAREASMQRWGAVLDHTSKADRAGGVKVPRKTTENNPSDLSFPSSRYLASKVSLRGNGSAGMQVQSGRKQRGRGRGRGGKQGGRVPVFDERVHMIGRAMHMGDDEGRPPARKVKIQKKDDDDGGIDVQRQGNDEAEEADEDEDEDDGDGYKDDNAMQESDDSNNDDNDEDDGDSLSLSEMQSADRISSAGRRRAQNNAPLPAGNDASDTRRRSQRTSVQNPSTRQDPTHNDGDSASGISGCSIGSHRHSNHPASLPGSRQSPGHRAYVRLSKCWLCTFSNSRMAKSISEFVSTHAGAMDPTVMADQIKREVLREVGVFMPVCHMHVSMDILDASLVFNH